MWFFFLFSRTTHDSPPSLRILPRLPHCERRIRRPPHPCHRPRSPSVGATAFALHSPRTMPFSPYVCRLPRQIRHTLLTLTSDPRRWRRRMQNHRRRQMPADSKLQAAAAADTESPRAGENKHERLSTGTVVFSKPAPPAPLPPPPPHGRLTTSFGRPSPIHRISTRGSAPLCPPPRTSRSGGSRDSSLQQDSCSLIFSDCI
jgi:hypothetical protein